LSCTALVVYACTSIAVLPVAIHGVSGCACVASPRCYQGAVRLPESGSFDLRAQAQHQVKQVFNSSHWPIHGRSAGAFSSARTAHTYATHVSCQSIAVQIAVYLPLYMPGVGISSASLKRSAGCA
jgi:hypothetical protein